MARADGSITNDVNDTEIADEISSRVSAKLSSASFRSATSYASFRSCKSIKSYNSRKSSLQMWCDTIQFYPNSLQKWENLLNVLETSFLLPSGQSKTMLREIQLSVVNVKIPSTHIWLELLVTRASFKSAVSRGNSYNSYNFYSCEDQDQDAVDGPRAGLVNEGYQVC